MEKVEKKHINEASRHDPGSNGIPKIALLKKGGEGKSVLRAKHELNFTSDGGNSLHTKCNAPHRIGCSTLRRAATLYVSS